MFAQEGLMDFQKEKEAFESVFTEAKGWDLTFIMGCYQNIETLRAFAGWLAAKAQAVPEGFVLVPMVPSERMINAVRQCYEGEAYLPYSLYSEFVNQAIIERMEAQEPTND